MSSECFIARSGSPCHRRPFQKVSSFSRGATAEKDTWGYDSLVAVQDLSEKASSGNAGTRNPKPGRPECTCRCSVLASVCIKASVLHGFLNLPSAVRNPQIYLTMANISKTSVFTCDSEQIVKLTIYLTMEKSSKPSVFTNDPNQIVK